MRLKLQGLTKTKAAPHDFTLLLLSSQGRHLGPRCYQQSGGFFLMSEHEVTLKLRLPAERYIALRHLANEEGRSMNGQVNNLISQALYQELTKIKERDRGQNGGNEENE